MATTIRSIDVGRVINALQPLCDILAIAESQHADGQNCRHMLDRAEVHAQTLASYLGNDRDAIVSSSGEVTTTDYLRELYDVLWGLREYVLSRRTVEYVTSLPAIQQLRRWLALLKEAETTKDGPDGDDDETPTPRLVVCVDSLKATLDGKEYTLPTELAGRWLKVLADNPGKWIRAKELKEYDSTLIDPRTDRIEFHRSIQKLIESKAGIGSRLVLPVLA